MSCRFVSSSCPFTIFSMTTTSSIALPFDSWIWPLWGILYPCVRVLLSLLDGSIALKTGSVSVICTYNNDPTNVCKCVEASRMQHPSKRIAYGSIFAQVWELLSPESNNIGSFTGLIPFLSVLDSTWLLLPEPDQDPLKPRWKMLAARRHLSPQGSPRKPQ